MGHNLFCFPCTFWLNVYVRVCLTESCVLRDRIKCLKWLKIEDQCGCLCVCEALNMGRGCLKVMWDCHQQRVSRDVRRSVWVCAAFFPFVFTRGVTLRSLVCTLVLVVKIWYIFLAQQEKPTTFCGHNSYFKNLGADTGIFLIKINNTLRPVDNSWTPASSLSSCVCVSEREKYRRHKQADNKWV